MGSKDFTALLKYLSDSKDTSGIIASQRNTLRRYEETNEMLRQFLDLSDATHRMLLENYAAHAKTLNTLKKDLENSFKRIRTLKTELKDKYPEAFEATAEAIKELTERYHQEDEEYFRRCESKRSEETAETINQDGETIQDKTVEDAAQSSDVKTYVENISFNLDSNQSEIEEYPVPVSSSTNPVGNNVLAEMYNPDVRTNAKENTEVTSVGADRIQVESTTTLMEN